MPYLDVRGVSHYYEWIASPAGANPEQKPNPGKPTMVFIHGWGGSARYWETTAQAMADRYDCLLYDMRGFGRSRFSRPVAETVSTIGYELETYADDLAVLLEELGLDRVFLNAHSTGSSVAVLFMNRHPERVERTILTCHGVFEYDERSFKAFHQFGGYVVKFRPAWMGKIPGVDRLFMQRFLRRSIPRQASRAFLEDYLMAEEEAALGTIYTAVSERASIEMPEEYRKLHIPTLLVSGEYDQIIPAALGRTAASMNPTYVKQVVMPETAHFPMLEDPQTYMREVEAFLQPAETAAS
ncbi:alpha/beta fold hydrolase [Leptolyngbya ohadii]|uniref:alpha/beta fold hydrolase n=1 Tax=Leptolyngbya ohadii TaxID=1962290 RepID=UPI000B5A1F87|nr:alpha/beta hydrolase [Leptolyngbya ohadii]